MPSILRLHPYRWWHHGHTLRVETRRWRRRKSALRSIQLHIRRRGRRHAHLHAHLHRRQDSLLRSESWRWRGLREHSSKLALVRPLKAGHRWPSAESQWGWRWTGCHGQRVVFSCLGGKEAFGGSAMAFALAVLFECILDGNRFVHEELAIHRLNSRVRGLKVRVRDETVAFGFASARITGDLHEHYFLSKLFQESVTYLGSRRHYTKGAKSII